MDTKRGLWPAPALARLTCLSFLGTALLLAGCSAGSGSGNSGNSVSVTITNKVTSIQAGTVAITFVAIVQNDSSNSGVTWSLSANGAACSPTCGSLSLTTLTAVTYTPPISGPAAPNNQPTLTAVSIAKTNKSDSSTFTISPALTVSITNKFSSANTGTSAFVVNATAQNDSTNSGVSWTLTANGIACSPACGTLSGATSSSVTYSPPSSVPTAPNNQPTLEATSVHDNSKSDSDGFTIDKAPIIVVIQGKVNSAIAGSSGIFFAANVENDPSSNASTSWTLTVNGTDCTNTCGTLTAAGTQSVVYNPPASVPASPNNKPTLSAISATDTTKSDSDTFTITVAPPISVSVSHPTSVLAGATGGVNFSANVRNDFNNPPKGVTWALTVGGSACSPSCGSLSNVATTSVTYTPPASAPTAPNNQPTLTATSVADNTKSGSDIFTITSSVANSCGAAGGNESLLNGHYALLMEGIAGSGTGTPILIAASFVANGSGSVTGGEEDINDTVSPQHLTFTSGGSLYTVGADHRGCLQLTSSGGTTTVFRFSLGGISSGIASKGRIIEFDDNSGSGTGSRGSGILRLQDPNSFVLSALQSQYAFGVDGWGMENNQLVHFNTAGSFSNSGGALTNGVYDVNFAGITTPDSTGLTSGTNPMNPISTTTGRTTGSFDFFDWAIYVVNSSQFFVIGTDPIQSTVSVGRAIATGNSFAASSLSGDYVVHETGNTNGSADVNLELLAMTPGGAQAGTLSGTVYSYGGGSGAQTTTLSGVTYNVDSASGRVTLGNPSDNLPILYLTTPTDGIAAFVVGVGSDAIFGLAEAQTSHSLAVGGYIFGTEDPADNTVANKAGAETIASGGGLTGTFDVSSTSGLQNGQTTSATVSLGADGTGNVGAQTVAITSGSKLFSIDESSSAPAVIVTAEQ
jgi:hypothetical protein